MKTLEEAAAYLAPIWKAERGRYGRANVPAPSIERPNMGQRRAVAHYDPRITLPRWACNEWVILHEAAHRLSPADEPRERGSKDRSAKLLFGGGVFPAHAGGQTGLEWTTYSQEA